MIVKNGVTYQLMLKYDGVLFDREWYSNNCSDLDLILYYLTYYMYVAIAKWLAICFVCLLYIMLLHVATIK